MYSPTPTIADSRTGLSEIPLPDSVKVQMISLPDDVKAQLIPLPDSMKVQFHISSGNGKNWERGKLECLIHAVVVSHAVVVRKFAMPLQNHSAAVVQSSIFFSTFLIFAITAATHTDCAMMELMETCTCFGIVALSCCSWRWSV